MIGDATHLLAPGWQVGQNRRHDAKAKRSNLTGRNGHVLSSPQAARRRRPTRHKASSWPAPSTPKHSSGSCSHQPDRQRQQAPAHKRTQTIGEST
jgi:hypothetical protein